MRRTMVEGESGILSCYPFDSRPEYAPAKGEIYFKSGALAQVFSGDKPDQLRGPQFSHAWVDELMKFQYAREAWDNLEMAVRLGDDPRIIVTTTPRPTSLMRELNDDPDTFVTTGRTTDNLANLPKRTVDRLVGRYWGTAKGRQELEGEILEEVEGAIVARSMIEAGRKERLPGPMERIVVAIDPPATSGQEADEAGIVAVGLRAGHVYVLSDRSRRDTPLGWARRAVELFDMLGGDRIVGEVNNGGEMIEATLRQVDPNLPYRAVHASRGKHVRFEPVGALYEQGRVHHVGSFPELEDQVCAFTAEGYEGSESPDRADAMVWAVTELMFGASEWGWSELYGTA